MARLKQAGKLVEEARLQLNGAERRLAQRERIFENMKLMYQEPMFQLKNASAWTLEDVCQLRHLPYGDVYGSGKKIEESKNWAMIKKLLDAFRSLDPMYIKLYIMIDVMDGYPEKYTPKHQCGNYLEARKNAKNLLEKLWQDFSNRSMPQETYDAILADKYAKDVLGPIYKSCALIMKQYKRGKTPNGPGQNWVGRGRRVV